MKSIFSVFTVCWLLIFNSGVAMGIEEPKFSVDSKNENYEVRSYESVLIAEVTVDGDFESAGNRGFKILADYIFGNNTTQAKIAMSAPVVQAKSEKIAMTAPVNLSKNEKGYLIQFTMPESFNLQTLPKPNNEVIQIREIPKRKVAVFSYSGSWSESRYKAKLSEFLKHLEADKVKTVGEPIFARFNSPFQLWFLRRNEIWLEILQ